jgi:hypothetical protein
VHCSLYKVINITRHRSIKHCTLCTVEYKTHTSVPKTCLMSPALFWVHAFSHLDCVLRDVFKFPPWCCRWRFQRKFRLIFVDYFCQKECLRTSHRLAKRCLNRQSWWRQFLRSDTVSGNKTSLVCPLVPWPYDAWNLVRNVVIGSWQQRILGLVNVWNVSLSYTAMCNTINLVAYPRLTTYRRRLYVDLISTEIWLIGGIFMQKRTVI